MFWFFNNTTNVEDDSLKVQSKEYAVKAFNKLIAEKESLEEQIKPLNIQRDEINGRRLELCDLARACQLLTKVLTKQQVKKVRSIWDGYIKEHGQLSEQLKSIKLEIDTLFLKKKKITEKAQQIFNDNNLHDLNMKFPW